MPRSIEPHRPLPPPAVVRTRAAHHEGELLGVRYQVGIRVSELAPPEQESSALDAPPESEPG